MNMIGIILVTLAVAAMFLLVKAESANAATYRVGLMQEIKGLGDIAEKLQPGDTVEIEPGIYREVLKLRANGTEDAPIIIRGAGETRPVFDADGLNVSGRGGIPRGIFQIEGAYYIIEHLEFKNARNGNNAAGIRLLGSTNAIINWIPTSAEAPATFTNTIKGDAPGFLSIDERDFRLQTTSLCIDSGVEALEYIDGDGQKHQLVIDRSYVPHLKVTRRKAISMPDLGAYEVGLKFDKE